MGLRWRDGLLVCCLLYRCLLIFVAIACFILGVLGIWCFGDLVFCFDLLRCGCLFYCVWLDCWLVGL